MKYKKIFFCGPYEILQSEDKKSFLVRTDSGADGTYILKTNSIFRAFNYVKEELRNYTMFSFSIIQKQEGEIQPEKLENVRNPDYSVKLLAEKMWGADNGKL